LLGHFPSVADFIQQKANSYPSLKVNYVRGAKPVLKLSGPSGEDTISIGTFKTEEIEQFLKEKLKN